MKSQLRDKTERVAELEENLVGKQLALDKIIEENQKLQKTIAEINKQGVRVLKYGAINFVLPPVSALVLASGSALAKC